MGSGGDFRSPVSTRACVCSCAAPRQLPVLPLPHCASLPFREPRLAVSVPQTLKATLPLEATAAAPTGAEELFGAGSSENGAAERFFFLSCDAPRGTKAPTRRPAAKAQARDIPPGALGMDSTSARGGPTPQEWRGPRPRIRLPTAETGPSSPQTAISSTTTSMLGAAVNSNIVPIFSTGRLAQGRPGVRTWNRT